MKVSSFVTIACSEEGIAGSEGGCGLLCICILHAAANKEKEVHYEGPRRHVITPCSLNGRHTSPMQPAIVALWLYRVMGRRHSLSLHFIIFFLSSDQEHHFFSPRFYVHLVKKTISANFFEEVPWFLGDSFFPPHLLSLPWVQAAGGCRVIVEGLSRHAAVCSALELEATVPTTYIPWRTRLGGRAGGRILLLGALSGLIIR